MKRILQADPARWRPTLTRLGLEPDAYDPGVPARFFAGLARRHGVPCVDLTPALRAAVADGRAVYFRHDPHWTAEGHRLAAEALRLPVARLLAGAAEPSPEAVPATPPG